MKQPVKLLNSSLKNTSVIVLDPNLQKIEKLELQTESDPELQRLTMFSSANLKEARRLVRENKIDLAFLTEKIDGMDFVSQQQELKNSNGEIEFIVLTASPGIDQLRDSKRIGGVTDFRDPKIINDYKLFKSALLDHFRTKAAQVAGPSKLISYVSSIQNAILVARDSSTPAASGSPTWGEIKNGSKIMLASLIPGFDFSLEEASRIIATERIYCPWLKPSEFSHLLGEDPFELLSILKATGSWTYNTSPSSTAGFLITLANYLAEQCAQGRDAASGWEEIKKRPTFLKHPSIRRILENHLEECWRAVQGRARSAKKG